MNGQRKYGIHIQWDVIQAKRRKGILPQATACMNLEDITLTEISK